LPVPTKASRATLNPLYDYAREQSTTTADNQPERNLPPERRHELIELGVRHGVDACQNNWITSGVPAKPSALVDTRVIYCGDNLEQLRKLPAAQYLSDR
jgi:hypothetical protein